MRMRPPPAIETTRRHPTPVRLSSQPFVSKLASHVACVCSSILCSHCSASTSGFVPSAKVLGKADDPHPRESVKELIKSPSRVSLDQAVRANCGTHAALCSLASFVVQCRKRSADVAIVTDRHYSAQMNLVSRPSAREAAAHASAAIFSQTEAPTWSTIMAASSGTSC